MSRAPKNVAEAGIQECRGLPRSEERYWATPDGKVSMIHLTSDGRVSIRTSAGHWMSWPAPEFYDAVATIFGESA